ncbi:gluconate 2-dehydrogenase subunit 3 family protein [Ilyomonas limi]|uniref:Gluconate 2-dehydrogenase subunit 3 family protein n=1 Tax=Ilyomonas limi TaxID=2575867 RepID=A0A4U3L350_9BACT|nr:gluconate 2-dehydrogenase subunit 3 family protein [Ilyomonas limi]TKK67996.1 gluconate 2-dehydrogenase subunit 3 family protein [Ilyomonas limi]
MNINRRSAIKQFIILSAGVALLPSCKSNKKVSLYNNILINEDQQAMLAEVAETILPTTDTPGAKDISAHLFALQMMNDCYKADDREKFVKGMQQFEEKVQKEYSKTFAQCTPQERQSIVAAAEAHKDAKDEAQYFYNTLKRLTVQAYTGSKYYLTNIQVYKLVPGKYISSVAV